MTKKDLEKDSATTSNTTSNTTYANPLFQNIQGQKLNKNNFPVYQKDLMNILTHIIVETSKLKGEITPTNLNESERIKTHIKGIHQRANLLGDYCSFFQKTSENITLPYQYLGDIAHKYKPLGHSIDVHLSLYQKEDEDEKEKLFKEIQESIEKLITNIAKANREVGEMQFGEEANYHTEIFSPESIISDLIAVKKPLTRRKNISIKNVIPNTYNLKSYKKIFEMVMNNLITNAINHTPERGEINIGIERDDYSSDVTFFVKDSGVGIPENIDVFKHGYTTPSTDGREGTGLGLSQAQIFLKIINGELTHKKNTPTGTIFLLTMPKTKLEKE